MRFHLQISRWIYRICAKSNYTETIYYDYKKNTKWNEPQFISYRTGISNNER